MSQDKAVKSTCNRHKAREAALQMLFAADLVQSDATELTQNYWDGLGEIDIDQKTRDFADDLVHGTIDNIKAVDEIIKTRAEHWRIERMAIVDRNVLRLAVYEFLHQDTPPTVIINEALELARRFSSYEATQFINGVLDAIKQDRITASGSNETAEKSQASSI